MSQSHLEYCNGQDRKVIYALVKKVLADGYSISINDGEDTTVEFSTDRVEILKAMTSTGEDYLMVNSGSKELGYFYLIYDNGSDDEPMVVISDVGYSNTPEGRYCSDLYEALDQQFGR
jgi:hypothetical protein